MKFEYVIFDLGGVVFSHSNLHKDVLFPILKLNGELLEENELDELVKRLEQGELTESRFWRETKVHDFEKIKKNFLNRVLSSLDSDFEQLSLNLKNKIKMGILTNMADVWVDEFMDSFCFKGLFDIQVVSSIERVSKPDPKIYDILIEKCSCAPEKILFIDDKIKNLKSAKEKGISTVWMIREPKKTEFMPDYIINSLLQIEDIIND